MKIVTIVGARPQFIKAAVVSRAIEGFNERHSRSGSGLSREKIEEIFVHTGQHYDYSMDRIFFEELKIQKAQYNLGIGSSSHGKQTGRMLEGIETVLEKEKPEFVIVYGDTNSTLAGALASAKLHIPIAHVEAGLRSHNRRMPEEINRVLTDHLSTFLFCPTAEAVQNLKREGIKNGASKIVKKVGDVMYDSVLYYSDLADKKATILRDLGFIFPLIPQSAIRNPQYFLATLHRAENTDDPRRFKSILRGLRMIGRKAPVILPVHPRTKKVMISNRLLPEGPEVRVIEPVSYLNMLALEKHARAVLTDSGGVQKEACWLRVPCITLRDETEWVETVRSGWNVLAGADPVKIMEAVENQERKKRSRRIPDLFGDGKAGERIVETLARGNAESK